MTVAIRRVTHEDAEAVSAVISEVRGDPEPVGLDELSPAEVGSWIDRQGAFGALFIMDDDAEVIGFASVDFDSSRATECSIGAWIRPVHRRMGYASALIEETITFARDHGYSRVHGRLPEGNEAALSFLSTIGALVPILNPGAQYELPTYEVRQ
jgi:RimJ/RimL family protein N-acetyltransferase